MQLLDPERRLGDQAPALRARTERALARLDATGSVRIRVVGDAEMTELHARWLGEPSTTDVMTFDLTDGDSGESRRLDVDLYLCADEAARQAARHGHARVRELLLYAIHGVLHCLGYDDGTPAESEAMHHAEDEVLRAIGVGATFAPDAEPGPRDDGKGSS